MQCRLAGGLLQSWAMQVRPQSASVCDDRRKSLLELWALSNERQQPNIPQRKWSSRKLLRRFWLRTRLRMHLHRPAGKLPATRCSPVLLSDERYLLCTLSHRTHFAEDQSLCLKNVLKKAFGYLWLFAWSIMNAGKHLLYVYSRLTCIGRRMFGRNLFQRFAKHNAENRFLKYIFFRLHRIFNMFSLSAVGWLWSEDHLNLTYIIYINHLNWATHTDECWS